MVKENIPVDALEGVYASIKEATSHANFAAGLVSVAIRSGNPVPMPAFDHARLAAETAEQAAQTLHKLGVRTPTAQTAQTAPRKAADPFDLSTLAALDTSDKRELLALLEQAQAVAERVDAASGRTLPAHLPVSPGESRGTDVAETISNLAYRLRDEVYGQMIGRE